MWRRFLVLMHLISVMVLFPVTVFPETPDDPGQMRTQAREAISSGDLARADKLLVKLLDVYPHNPELLAMRGRVLYRTKRYGESVAHFDRALAEAEDSEVRAERNRAVIARDLSNARAHLTAGRIDEAEALLVPMVSSRTALYDSGMLLGRLYLGRRQYRQARDVYETLRQAYPDDRDIAALSIESKILAGQTAEARRELEALPSEASLALTAEREDLLYRIRKHPIALRTAYYEYSAGYGEEKSVSLTVARPIGPFTAIVGGETVEKFDLTDHRATLEVYARAGERAGRWGYVSFSAAPDPDFLPSYTAGGEIFQSLGGIEYSAGYTHMEFENASADILKVGGTVFLPWSTWLTEKVYYAPKTGSYAFDTSVHAEPDHHFRGTLGVTFGEGAERMGSALELQRVPTTSGRVGGEYRWSPSFSAGCELSYEHRSGLYQRRGVALFLRYWP